MREYEARPKSDALCGRGVNGNEGILLPLNKCLFHASYILGLQEKLC